MGSKRQLSYTLLGLCYYLHEKIWTRPYFPIELSKKILSPPTSSGVSYLSLGKVSGGAPLILLNFSHGSMCVCGIFFFYIFKALVFTITWEITRQVGPNDCRSRVVGLWEHGNLVLVKIS